MGLARRRREGTRFSRAFSGQQLLWKQYGNQGHRGDEGILYERKRTGRGGCKARPIHVYLLRRTDKVKILKAAAKALKEKVFFESQIYIYIYIR